MKNCPYCAEEIQDAAIVCKHCQRDFTASRSAALGVEIQPSKRKTSPVAWGCLATILVLVAATVVGTCSTRSPSGVGAHVPAAAPPANKLALLSASGGPTDSASYMEVHGEVENISSESLKGVAAVATWYDASDQFIASETTLIEYDPILPGQKSPFKVITRANPAMQRYSVGFKRLFGGSISTDDRRKK